MAEDLHYSDLIMVGESLCERTHAHHVIHHLTKKKQGQNGEKHRDKWEVIETGKFQLGENEKD